MADVTPIERAPRRRTAQLPAGQPEPLWRDVLGERLRELRQDQQQKLVDTAGRAGISPQYLSEIERGRKDPSSEMIAAVAGALGTSLVDLTSDVSDELRRRSSAAGRRAHRQAQAQVFALAA